MDCSLPGSSVHGIFQARVLEWVAISFSRESSPPRDRTQVSRIVGIHFTVWATREVSLALTGWTFVDKVMSLFFNMLSRLVITFLQRSKHLLILWLQSPFTVILKPKKIKSVTDSLLSPSICHEVMGLDAMIFVFWMLSFKPVFSLSSFTFIKRLFGSSSLSAIVWCHLHIRGYWYFSWQSWFQLVLHPAQHFTWCTLHISYYYKVNSWDPCCCPVWHSILST